MKVKRAWAFLKEVFSQWLDDKALRLGAALAYYTVFSIAPLLIIVIAIAGLFFGEQAARGEIVGEIEQTIGRPGAEAIEGMLRNTQKSGGSVWVTIFGIAILLFGATGVFIQLQDALNTIWKVQPKPGRCLRGIISDRFQSFTIVLGTGFLLLVSLSVSAGLAALNRFVTPEALPGSVYLWEAVNILISFGIITILFAMIFRILPDAIIAWRDVWIGALITAGLFTGGKYLIGLYLANSGTASVFGAAGSFVIVLLWVYYSSQILLLGAEITRVYADWYGTRVVPSENATAVTAGQLATQGMPQAAAKSIPNSVSTPNAAHVHA